MKANWSILEAHRKRDAWRIRLSPMEVLRGQESSGDKSPQTLPYLFNLKECFAFPMAPSQLKLLFVTILPGRRKLPSSPLLGAPANQIRVKLVTWQSP